MRSGVLWVLGFLTLSIDGLVWGVAACTLHRALRRPKKRGLGLALVAGLIFVAWDQWVFGEFAHWAGMPRGHAEPARWLEAGIGFLATLAGFLGGQALLSAIARRDAQEASASRAAAAHPASRASPSGQVRGHVGVADQPSEPGP
jgi:hypothetical protein